ncbi:WD repeat-containing protein 13-like isoform X2 [Arctopsyche grandis]|uniref:WD repeat-containing protein 13-like isoform X2 n=1 Tax=Arctopsyche grandis TaxID=121162 RepID=UPI00406D6AB1
MALAFQQQIFALDAKYNAHRAPNCPNFRTLYIRRRNQLLRENAKFKDIDTIKQYLNIRGQLLQRKYGMPHEPISSPANLSRQKSNNKNNTSASDPRHKLSRVTESTVSQNYAFTGVHHIFDQHTEPVTVLKFANNDRSRLCCASDDGSLSICDVTAKPPQVSFVLRGHSKGVTGCDWSASNDLLVSCSRDGTLCLWNVGNQKCLRKVFDQLSTEILCCTFQPSNNNMVITGNARGIVQVLNISTGIYPKGGSVLGGKVLSLVCDSSGRMFWAGNDKGLIISYNCDIVTGRLSKLRRMLVGGAVSCLSWSPWVCRHPALLVNCTNNSVNLFRVTDKEGGLTLKRRFNNLHMIHPVRSTFCPIMSFRKGICVVTGSEDSCVYFLDIESSPDHPVVNKLQGHAAPVLGVSFNYDESFLASSDMQGLVIIWRRS